MHAQARGHARAWMQRITCNYGPCHLPCLVPVLCARDALSLVERLRHAWRKRREYAEYADNETLQALLPVTRLIQRRLTATGNPEREWPFAGELLRD